MPFVFSDIFLHQDMHHQINVGRNLPVSQLDCCLFMNRLI